MIDNDLLTLGILKDLFSFIDDDLFSYIYIECKNLECVRYIIKEYDIFINKKLKEKFIIPYCIHEESCNCLDNFALMVKYNKIDLQDANIINEMIGYKLDFDNNKICTMIILLDNGAVE